MFEFKIIFVNQSEILAGVMIDQGQYEKTEDNWINFTRLRIGLIVVSFDFTWYETE
jgi:hypothetical protein